MTTQDQIKAFFLDPTVKECIKVQNVEKLAGIPPRALYSFIRDGKYRNLIPENINKLIPVITKLGFKNSKS